MGLVHRIRVAFQQDQAGHEITDLNRQIAYHRGETRRLEARRSEILTKALDDFRRADPSLVGTDPQWNALLDDVLGPGHGAHSLRDAEDQLDRRENLAG
jgi:hypothetical protein